MNRKETIFPHRASKMFCHIMPAAAVLAGMIIMPKVTEAASFDIFLIAEQLSPAATASAASPLSVTTQTVYQLGGLNSNNRATSATQVSNFSFSIDTALAYNNQANPDPSQPNDSGEPGTAAYINSEIATWENSGIAGTTPEADEQIDFGRNASMTFNPVAGGFTDLILSDLGGLNPFDLSLCSDAACTSAVQLFAGFSRTLTNKLIGLSDFSATDDINDGGQDQTWLFRFDSPIMDYVRILEFDNRNVFSGARLQADFIGVQAASAPSTVPGPATLPLLAGSLMLMGWGLRRRKD